MGPILISSTTWARPRLNPQQASGGNTLLSELVGKSPHVTMDSRSERELLKRNKAPCDAGNNFFIKPMMIGAVSSIFEQAWSISLISVKMVFWRCCSSSFLTITVNRSLARFVSSSNRFISVISLLMPMKLNNFPSGFSILLPLETCHRHSPEALRKRYSSPTAGCSLPSSWRCMASSITCRSSGCTSDVNARPIKSGGL